MSRRIGQVVIIEHTSDDERNCELCGMFDETPEMEKVVEHNMRIVLFGQEGTLL